MSCKDFELLFGLVQRRLGRHGCLGVMAALGGREKFPAWKGALGVFVFSCMRGPVGNSADAGPMAALEMVEIGSCVTSAVTPLHPSCKQTDPAARALLGSSIQRWDRVSVYCKQKQWTQPGSPGLPSPVRAGYTACSWGLLVSHLLPFQKVGFWMTVKTK